MADIEQTETKKKSRAGVRRSKKLSTRVDLTPMVDLGFLLITFFIFSTTISKPMSTKLFIPDDNSKDSSETAAGKTISLILVANNNIYYYNGDSINNIYSTNYSADGLRQILMNKKNEVKRIFGNPDETTVLIKPTDLCSYGNVVNVLDEIHITEIHTYVLMNPSPTETQFLAQKN